MVRLEDRLVVVRERVLMLRLLEELVVHARVLIVVDCRRDDAREPVERRDQLVDELVPDEVVGVDDFTDCDPNVSALDSALMAGAIN